MNNPLSAVALLAIIVAGGSAAYYYAIYLPTKDAADQATLQAQMRAAAPTPEQQRSAAIQQMQDQDAKMKAYSDCNEAMLVAMGVYVKNKCPDMPFPFYGNCALEAQKSFSYRDCREELF